MSEVYGAMILGIILGLTGIFMILRYEPVEYSDGTKKPQTRTERRGWVIAHALAFAGIALAVAALIASFGTSFSKVDCSRVVEIDGTRYIAEECIE